MSLINEALKKKKFEGGKAQYEHVAATQFGPGNPANSPAFQIVKAAVGFVIAMVLGGVAVGLFYSTISKPEPAPTAQEPTSDDFAVQLPTLAPEAASEKTQQLSQAQPRPSIPEQQLPQIAVNTAPVASTPQPATQQPTQAGISATSPGTAVTPTPAPSVASPSVASPSVASPSVASPSNTEPKTITPAAPPGEPTVIEKQANEAGIAATPAQPVHTFMTPLPAEERPLPEAIPMAEPSQEVIAFLEQSKIMGIRVAGNNSRVLMNNQIYKIGSLVQPSTKLRISSIEPNEVHFIDESGAQYRKQFRR